MKFRSAWSRPGPCKEETLRHRDSAQWRRPSTRETAVRWAGVPATAEVGHHVCSLPGASAGSVALRLLEVETLSTL